MGEIITDKILIEECKKLLKYFVETRLTEGDFLLVMERVKIAFLTETIQKVIKNRK